MKRLTIFSILFILLCTNAFSQGKQFLYIEFTPTDATLEINGEVQQTEDGTFQKLLPMGNYKYRLHRDGYGDLNGFITINNPDDTHYLELKLKKPFGQLSISCEHLPEIQGAEVYINGNRIGTLPIVDYTLASGVYNVTIKHPLYCIYSDTVLISDESVTKLHPEMVGTYIDVQLATSHRSAYIYANGECLGQGSWNGKLPIDQPITFESRETGYDPGKVEYILSSIDQGETIQIPAPTPTYGSLIITSKPARATIYLDGKNIGETPKYISAILSCTHEVEVKNYNSHAVQIVNIEKGKEQTIHFVLEIGDTVENEVIEEVVEEEAIPFQLVEEKPSFKGGDANTFSKWVNQRLVYPEIAKENGVQGRVTLQFTVEKDGSVTRVKVLRGIARSNYQAELDELYKELKKVPADDPARKDVILDKIGQIEGEVALDKEAVRVVSSSPKWTPGKQRERAVPVTYTFPVIFQLR